MDKPYRRTGEAVVRAVPAGGVYYLDFPSPPPPDNRPDVRFVLVTLFCSLVGSLGNRRNSRSRLLHALRLKILPLPLACSAMKMKKEEYIGAARTVSEKEKAFRAKTGTFLAVEVVGSSQVEK